MSVTKKDKELIEGRLRVSIGLGMALSGAVSVYCAKHPEKKVPIAVGGVALAALLTFGLKQFEKRISR